MNWVKWLEIVASHCVQSVLGLLAVIRASSIFGVLKSSDTWVIYLVSVCVLVCALLLGDYLERSETSHSLAQRIWKRVWRIKS